GGEEQDQPAQPELDQTEEPWRVVVIAVDRGQQRLKGIDSPRNEGAIKTYEYLEQAVDADRIADAPSEAPTEIAT
ncbi:MAG: hypothetical protein O6944_03635, partial [Gammaproteobacteria bacterium]|nr:hypothetical protein [Gammaproteobacteria bacterium]